MRSSAALLWSIALLLPVLGSCAQSGPSAPSTPQHAAPPITQWVQPVETLTSGADQVVALFHLQIDPETNAVQVENVTHRSLQNSPQAKSFDLELWGAILDGQGNPFLTLRGTQQFNVTGVTDIPGLGKLVTWTHRHPLNAPNFATGPAHFYTNCADCLCYDDTPGPGGRPSERAKCLRVNQFGTVRPSALNRCDLSYTGRAVFLGNVTGQTQTYFGGIAVDTESVVNADGYLDVRDVINATGDVRHPGLTNTVFPYILLADDGKNNRTGIPNGGNPRGNYDPAAGGWQRSNIGGSNNAWTGYDFVHAGQTISNSVILKETPSGYDTYVALVVKYTDPRGASHLFWRWPTPTSEPLQFAYRLPYAALDCSVVQPPALAASLPAVQGETFELRIRVRDWDRAATAHTGSDLSGQSNLSLVQQGATGNPVVTLDAPFLSNTPFALTYHSGAGLPGDEAEFRGNVTNTLGTAAAGNYYALLRVVDPEDGDAAAGTYRFGIDNPPTYTNAQPGKALPRITYQVIPIELKLDKPLISAVTPSGCPTPAAGISGNGITFSAVIANSPTGWSWNFGGGATPNTATVSDPFVVLGAPGQYNGTLTATNAAGASTPFPFCFTVQEGIPTVQGVSPTCPRPAGDAGQSGVTITGTSIGGATTWSWSFGAAATITAGATTATPTVTLGSAGEYTCTVTAGNGAGTSDEFEFCILIRE